MADIWRIKLKFGGYMADINNETPTRGVANAKRVVRSDFF